MPDTQQWLEQCLLFLREHTQGLHSLPPPSAPRPLPIRSPCSSQVPDLVLPPSSPQLPYPLPCSVPRGQNRGWVQLPNGSLGQRAGTQAIGPLFPTSTPVLSSPWPSLVGLPLPQCPLPGILGEFLAISIGLPASSTQLSP